MKKYFSFFRLRLAMGLQYRTAAIAGLVTQFFWGFMLIGAYRAFYESNPSAFPMSFQAMVSYIWLQQAFLAVFITWRYDEDIFTMITDGGISYELARPVDLYGMWYAKNLAMRLSEAMLRFAPVLLLAMVLPHPFRLGRPASAAHFFLFLLTMVVGLLLTVAFLMIIYGLAMKTISPTGVRLFFPAIVEFMSGQIIPIPFFPEKLRKIAELLPFAGMQNVPLRIYSGDLSGTPMVTAVVLQFFWLLVFLGIGKLLLSSAEKRAVVQGG
ncbi:MAG: ABC transporter permease [Lachnospiraceae bacterium]|nr:ABC transporter permease [Lachnospiraceae bacterium]